MTVQTEYFIAAPDVVVGPQGIITLHLIDDTTLNPVEEVCSLSHKSAINLACQLVQGVQRSIDLQQVEDPRYYDSDRIIARNDSPLGRAISALREVYLR